MTDSTLSDDSTSSAAPDQPDQAATPAMRAVLDASAVNRALTRIAHEILERTQGADDAVLLGIPTRGAHLATRLGAQIAAVEGLDLPVGTLDVTMYRDDLGRKPTRAPAKTAVPASGIDGKLVVLVDDVLYSGRTIRAALDALSAIGRPRYVRLATLVDRGHRELPIRPDYIGKNLPTADGERVHVRLAEIDGVEEVTIES